MLSRHTGNLAVKKFVTFYDENLKKRAEIKNRLSFSF